MLFYPLAIFLSWPIMYKLSSFFGYTFNSDYYPPITNISKLDWFIEDTSVIALAVFSFWAIQRQTAAKNLELESFKAKVKALTIQINPHFLFNTLNTVVHYIEENRKLQKK